jgi:hypothetical protein
LFLSLQPIQDIETCNEKSRPLLLYTFAGAMNRGNVRHKLESLHNDKDVLVMENTRDVNMTYDDVLFQSNFFGAPGAITSCPIGLQK